MVSIAQGILGVALKGLRPTSGSHQGSQLCTDDDDSLQRRRRDIRRRRRIGQIRGWMVAAGWGTVALLAVWLLFSGIFGLSGA